MEPVPAEHGRLEAVPEASPLKDVGIEVFAVVGATKFMFGLMGLSRRMVVLRVRGSSLVIVNSVRLDDAGLAELEALGTVQHVMRLGDLHGMDDAFYVERYGATWWQLPNHRPKPEAVPADQLPPSRLLTEDAKLPFPAGTSRLFVFRVPKRPEAALILNDEWLLTSDACINWSRPTRDPYVSWFSRTFFKSMLVKCTPGPGWLMFCAHPPEYTGPPVTDDFDRLLSDEFKWRSILPAHGELIDDGSAREAMRAAVDALPPDAAAMRQPRRSNFPVVLVVGALAVAAVAVWWARR